MENPWPMRKIPQDTPQFNNKNYVMYMSTILLIPLENYTNNYLSLDTPIPHTQCHVCCAVYIYVYMFSDLLRVKRWIRLPGLAASLV